MANDISEKRWRLRVELADRPGSLAALSTALAAHNVDILRLDVVSRERIAVDDVWIELAPDDSIGQLEDVLRRMPGVGVLALSPAAEVRDPVAVMADACAGAAEAPTLEAVRKAGIEGACRIVGARHGVIVRPAGDGWLKVAATSLPRLADVRPEQDCLARQAAQARAPLSAAGDSDWAPPSWRTAAPAGWIAAVPPFPPKGGAFACLLVIREEDMPFQSGELMRLAGFARPLTAMLLVHPDGAQAAREESALEWRRVEAVDARTAASPR